MFSGMHTSGFGVASPVKRFLPGSGTKTSRSPGWPGMHHSLPAAASRSRKPAVPEEQPAFYADYASTRKKFSRAIISRSRADIPSSSSQ